jgi:hydroxyethylthiazole kinase-like uncharacterized protein yjeF
MRVLTNESMRAVDRAAIEELGIPSLVLMENAARGVVDALGETFPGAGSAALFCGPGNNGGDGLAVARHLAVRGYEALIFLASFGRELSPDAAVQLAICRKMGLPIRELIGDIDIAAAIEAASHCDLTVDALFGTGLSRPLAGAFAALVEAINALPQPLVAVDLPSGLSGSSAHPPGPHAVADLTVTFAAPKIPHLLDPAASAVGELAVADLGIPPRSIAEVPEEGGPIELAQAEELAALLPPRQSTGHKGTYGHALLVVGSSGKAGAAILAGRAAVRAGAGLVSVAVPEPLLATVDLGSLESMTVALAADVEGGLAAAAVPAVLAAAAGKTVVAIGPGLGLAEGTLQAVRELAAAIPLPLVLDADGLNAFAGRAGSLHARSAPTVLTPHPGEIGRLLGISSAEVQQDRLGAVRRAVRETGAVVVLKGHRTLVGTPVPGTSDVAVSINPTGNPGMATGGTGDVLTGLVAGLLAQGLAVGDAARLAVFLHGAAGDAAVAGSGEEALAAAELIDHLPAAFRLLREGADD